MKYVDVKITTWQRLHFTNKTDISKIIEVLKNKDVSEVYDEELGFLECETLFETEEPMSVDNNEGEATLEVYDGDDLVWTNSIK